jgi:hypothetical protein
MQDQGGRRPAFIVGFDNGYADPAIGYRWLLEQESGDPLILVPQQSQLRHGALDELVGEVAARHLLRPGWTTLGHPPRTVYGATWRSFPSAAWPGGPVLAFWPTEEILAKVERSLRATAICAVPWSEEDRIEDWARAARAIDLSHPDGAPLEGSSIEDPVVEVALRSLTTSVNLGTGLHHPSDRTMAIETFRTLRRGGHTWDPDAIQGWARANGWDLDGARQLYEYAAGVQQGKRYRTLHGLRPEVLEMWRSDAEGR